MTTSFTTHFRFGIPDFLSAPWHADFQALVQKIDEVLYEIAIVSNIVPWANSTAYTVGVIVISLEDGLMYTCQVAHTSAASPTTFAADRIAHPTFWLAFGVGPDLSAIEALSTFGIAVRTADSLWATRTLVAPVAGLTITNPAGIAGSITFALANDLATIEALSSTGFASRTATDTWAVRTLTAPAAGFTITNPAGISGNPTFVLADDLAALEALAANGLIARTASNTYALRTLQSATAGLTWTNGDGVAGNPVPVFANDLAALEALSTSGFSARTGTDTWAIRTLANATEGLTWTNPAGTAGNPTPVFANDLAALEALSSTGLAARTASDTWAQRTITGPAAGITVSNGSGAGGNPTLALANDLSALEALSSSGFAERTGTDTWASTGFTGTGNVVRATGGDLSGNVGYTESIVVAVGDETTAITTGTGKVTFRMPYAFTATAVRASLTTAQTSGSIFTVDINEAGTTIISTKLTIDNTEKTSTTAATPAVISDASLADDAEITIDVDQIGDGTAKGLKVTLLGHR